LIVIELLVAYSFEETCKEIDLEGIEPFTLVVVDWKRKRQLFQFVWNGEQRYLKELDQRPYIWSSSTLYTNEMKGLRQEWFSKWFQEREISSASILKFHNEAGIGDPQIDVVLKREKVGTVSITQVVKTGAMVDMHYFPAS
jgi:hypothetical protein